MGKIGFIGLGIMGKPMALNLLRFTSELLINDLNHEAMDTLADAGGRKATLEEIGIECKIVFTILPKGDVVKDVLFGLDGIAQFMEKGSIVCDMSSVTPEESKECEKRLDAMSISFVDCPVSGGEPKAIDGTLAMMAGGKEEVFFQLKPYLDAMGSNAQLIGPVGSGSIAKLVNQVIVNLTIATVSEGFVLAAKAGVDPQKVYEAIRGGLAGSAVLDAKIPMILERNFQPGGKISINHKDMKNVIQTAHQLEVPMPLTAQLYEIYQSMMVHGHHDEDHCALVKYFETLAGVTVKK